MTHAKAETAQDIARLLRMMDSEQNLQSYNVAQRLLGKKTISAGENGIIITAPRQSGKTTELLKYAEEKNPNGQFAVVCATQEIQKAVIRRHWLLFNRIDQADIVAKKLLGQPLGGVDINPPLMITPGTLHLLRGSGRPVYVDELGIISNEDFMRELLASGRFVAAVTS